VADAVLALDGGPGTLSEIALALKLRRPLVYVGAWRFLHERPGFAGTAWCAEAVEAVAAACAAIGHRPGEPFGSPLLYPEMPEQSAQARQLRESSSPPRRGSCERISRASAGSPFEELLEYPGAVVLRVSRRVDQRDGYPLRLLPQQLDGLGIAFQLLPIPPLELLPLRRVVREPPAELGAGRHVLQPEVPRGQSRSTRIRSPSCGEGSSYARFR
jgi:hypothetical protein